MRRIIFIIILLTILYPPVLAQDTNHLISIEEPTLLLELFPNELHTIYVDDEDTDTSFYLLSCGRTDTSNLSYGGFELLLNRRNTRGDADIDIATWRTDQCAIYIVDTGDIANVKYRGDEGFGEALFILAPFDFRDDTNHGKDEINEAQLSIRMSFIERSETEAFINLQLDCVCIVANLTESSSILNQGVIENTQEVISAISGNPTIITDVANDIPQIEITLGSAQNNREYVREISEPTMIEIDLISDITDLLVACIIDDPEYIPEPEEDD